MTPRELISRRAAPLRLVIFDCDGVLVDSESISNGVLAREFTARGWPLTTEQAEALFVGTTLDAIEGVAERRLGEKLPPTWRRDIAARITSAMAAEAVAIPGAIESLHALNRLGMPWRVASNSSHAEMQAKFGRLGVKDLVAGRVHSYEDVARGKPAPDLYLATAAAGRVSPSECLVVEDSVAGATAARAAGIDCLGLDRFGDGTALAAVGAVPFRDMKQIPGLVALALEPAA